MTKKYELITAAGQITVNFGSKIENLIGSDYSDVLTGNELSNVLTGGKGNDIIDGDSGIDMAVYTVDFNESILTNFIDYRSSGTDIKLQNAWNVALGNEVDTLRNIERLKFEDKNIALDLDGNAGKIVKFLAVMLGKDFATNREYIGVGLKLLDNGMSYEEIMEIGFEVVLGPNASGSSIVDLLYRNVVGTPTPLSVLEDYGAKINDGSITSAQLGVAVADHDLNATNIDLIGLAQTGVEYFLTS